VLRALRPKPFRGDQVAAGVVLLTVLVALIDLRFAGDWDAAARLALTGAAAAFVLAMGVLSPLEDERPRAFQTVLYVGGFALAGLALGALSEVLGLDAVTALAAVAAGLAALGTALAVGRNSPTATLLAAVSGAVAVVAVIAAVADPGAQTVRWVLAGLVVAFVLGALSQRDRRPGHAVQLVNAAGLATLAIAGTYAAGLVFGLFGEAPAPAWGWELLVLAAGCGLIAYASVDRERGPAVLGVLSLAAFVALAATEDATLVGWPLALAVPTAVMLVIGLRPTTPAPPPPDEDRAPARTVALPPPDEPF
jgi:peptidoglycan/LPS O-acetylase OafA/YrhL